MLTLLLLLVISAIAWVEALVAADALTEQKKWLLSYRFPEANGWLYRFACSIPTQCPAEAIGLPPMCRLNPLYDEFLLLHLKAMDLEHQDDWIPRPNRAMSNG